MSKEESKKIVLPALRGIMGDWVYYSCLLNLKELSSRVDYAKKIHKNEKLSDMIQRGLEEYRGKLIAEYLQIQPERFFNSLILAVYGGQPNWHALSDIRNKKENDGLENLTETAIASVGFLTLSGDEKIFALDGQHRLAGIKKAIEDGLDQDPYDEVSVILVAHKNTSRGLERTRRLFTTINKTAKPVSKGGIIALDEDDVMAICVRRLIEETDLFSNDRIAFVANNNMPTTNVLSLTTIGNLYDILTILFTRANHPLKKPKIDLQRVRPDDDKLDLYFEVSRDFFIQLSKNINELKEFFDADDTTGVVRKYRGNHGGSALFRPIGLEIFVRVIAQLTKNMSLNDAIKLTAKLPRKLSEVPYKELMWNVNTRTISNSHKALLREILLYMLDASKSSEESLLTRYHKATGDEKSELPNKIE